MAGTKSLRSYLPQTSVDWTAFVFMVVMVHVICLFELLVVLNESHHNYNLEYIGHVCLGVYLYINVITNMVLVITTDATSGSVILPSVLKPGWRFCSVCEANAPPRSFHCSFCKTCILRRDHHCVFTGNCIGHTNQRYYIGLISFLCLGALYCDYLHIEYTWEIVGGLNFRSLFTLVLPLFAYALGYAGAFTFSVAFISSLSLIGFLLLAVLTSYHIINILNGQTVFERARGIKDYNYGWKENLRQVFGDRWILSWLLPWLSLPLPSNGIDFMSKYSQENVKDM